jgi:hypothetical protein
LVNSKTSYPFVDLDGQGPATPEGKVDYSLLANRGIDAALEVAVPAFRLVGTKGINPPLAHPRVAFGLTTCNHLNRTTYLKDSTGPSFYEISYIFL